MRLNLTFSLFLLFLVSSSGAFCQELTGSRAAAVIPGASRIRMNQEGNPAFITFDPSSAAAVAEITSLQQQLFGNRPEDTWVEIRSEEDRLGMVHTRYQQQYKGLNVDGHVFIFHSHNGKVVSANGHFSPGIDLSVVPAITPEQAIDYALAGMKVPVPGTDIDRTGTELVVAQVGGRAVLAYKTTVFSDSPLVNTCLYVDAQNGTILREVSQLCAVDATGVGHTQFSGNQAIVSDQLSAGNFILRESGRGGGIETINNNTGVPYADTDNDWNNVNGSMDEFAIDVHFGAEATYDFFYDNFARNSYDNLGGLIRSYVNDEGVGVNAYWSGGGDNSMHYGNGDANYFPVASLEVAGHELTHGVTEYSAGLQYFDESGALNESFSDIFGNTIRFLSAPANATWYIGDQILRPGGMGDAAFRNMSDPNEFLNPDTYGGLYFNSGDIVHYDSGIQNYWYYLLVEGGTGTNDIGNNFNVSGIGLNDAMEIAYRNLAYYLTPTSTFQDARYGSEQAAADLFGICSNQHLQVAHAWHAVGVGPDQQSIEVIAAFSNPGNFACTAPLTANFTAEGTYQSYSWDFGDGTTSTLQNPTHVYSNDGYYTVTLIVSNNNACQDPDTLIVPQGVVIDAIDPVAGYTIDSYLLNDTPIAFEDASLYGPTSWEWDFGDGGTSALQHPTHTYTDAGIYDLQLIVHNCHGSDTIVSQIEVVDYVLFCQTSYTDKPDGTIYDSGGQLNGYLDNEQCGLLIRPCHASSITLTVEELDLEEFFDYIFVFDGSDNTGLMIGAFTGSASQAPIQSTGGSMYIEFTSDVSNAFSGFKLSYTSVQDNFPNSNSANFLMMIPNPVVGQAVQFIDQSADTPLAWGWLFSDGSTSTLQHPNHTFTTPGMHSATLIVTFCDGFSDSFTMNFMVGEVGLDELSQQEQLLTIAPNPFSGYFVIGSDEQVQQLELRLFDMNGRVVYLQNEPVVSGEGITVAPQLLSTGQYILEARYVHENGTIGFERHKIQLQR
jgi:Zn-dependent metalloprotease